MALWNDKRAQLSMPTDEREIIDPATIRRLDPTCDGRLAEGEHQLIEMLDGEQKIDKTGTVTKAIIILKAMFAARMGPVAAKEFGSEMRSMAEDHTMRHDTELIRYRDPHVEEVITGLVDRLIDDYSRVIGMDHVVETVRGSQKKEPWSIYYVHNCNADPVIWSTLMKRQEEGTGPEDHRNAAAIMRRNQIAIAGQQMLMDKFRSMVANAMDTVITIPPKYQGGFTEEQQDLLQAHGTNFVLLLKFLQKHPDYIPLLAPEGGITPYRGPDKDKVKFLSSAAMKGLHVTPVDIEACRRFLQFGLGCNMSFGPTMVNAFVGKPFRLVDRRNPDELVEKTYDSLQRVGARVDEREWGVNDRTDDGGLEYRCVIPKAGS